jgi:hypothetical protein
MHQYSDAMAKLYMKKIDSVLDNLLTTTSLRLKRWALLAPPNLPERALAI